MSTVVHRFQELIAGRPYQIEVAPVSKDRWRAYIVLIPGVPTALMPFYGATPTDAAEQLCQWLTRAHELAAAAHAALVVLPPHTARPRVFTVSIATPGSCRIEQ